MRTYRMDSAYQDLVAQNKALMIAQTTLNTSIPTPLSLHIFFIAYQTALESIMFAA